MFVVVDRAVSVRGRFGTVAEVVVDLETVEFAKKPTANPDTTQPVEATMSQVGQLVASESQPPAMFVHQVGQWPTDRGSGI